jgi:hypothetical protein
MPDDGSGAASEEIEPNDATMTCSALRQRHGPRKIDPETDVDRYRSTGRRPAR